MLALDSAAAGRPQEFVLGCDGKGLSLAHIEPLCPSLRHETAVSRCSIIRAQLRASGVFRDAGDPVSDGQTPPSWRVSPCPFLISKEQLDFFTTLGPQLLSLYRALNRIYLDSVKGTQPAWIAKYLDQGKPDALVTFSRMKRFRDALPAVIRPDVIPTQDGMVITELDSVPGGIGLSAAMSRIYADVNQWEADGDENAAAETSGDWAPRSSPATAHAYEIVGGRDGMLRGFASMLKAVQGPHVGCVAILISEEAKEYRPEMSWLAAQLRGHGLSVYCVEPRDIRFTEEGLRLRTDTGEEPIGVLYRFYELFDLMNIPKAELIQYAAKKDRVALTPPYKPALEEKSAFALLHHPVLRPFWEKELGADCWLHLTTIMPRTWLLDPAPIPAVATIPGLEIGGRAVADWQDLATASQKERHLVIKPSGFSELAWGSRGVSVGHDLAQTEWAAALKKALDSFPRTPYILQEFHKGRLFDMDYVDPALDSMVRMSGRARLSPYYFVAEGKTELAGILATVCPADKKVIHGMKDAIMVPCALQPQQ